MTNAESRDHEGEHGKQGCVPGRLHTNLAQRTHGVEGSLFYMILGDGTQQRTDYTILA